MGASYEKEPAIVPLCPATATTIAVFEPMFPGMMQVIDVWETDLTEVAKSDSELPGATETMMSEVTAPKLFPNIVNETNPLVGAFKGLMLDINGLLKAKV
jgi:hypothetical protein